MQIEHIAAGAFVGALAAFAVKGLVDLLFHHFGPRDSRDPHAELADEAWREIHRVRRRQRATLYHEFDEKLRAAVDEMAEGWNRMSLIYAARDRFIAMQRLAPDPVVRAARKMCDVCIEMMDEGYSDTRYNRYHRARLAFEEQCRLDLARPPKRDDGDESKRDAGRGPRRKYITPHL